MKVQLDCFPCFFKQALIAVRLGTDDASFQAEVLKSICDEIKATDMSQPPAFSTSLVHRKIRQLLGKDPFKDIKSQYNKIALDLYPELKRRVQESADPLWTASRLAIAGNIIDFGIFTSIDIEGAIERSLHGSIAKDDYHLFREAVGKSDEALYLLDNAGEIVFDRVLIETLISRGTRVTAVVKGSPILNDVTLADAEETGLTAFCNVIDNGSDAVGTILDKVSPEFLSTFCRSHFIISKGQGNFETLIPSCGNGCADKEIFFLFQSKCDVLSRELQLPKGSMLLRKQ